MKQELAIRTQGLTRYFGKKCAVYELNLEVPRGAVFAFLGRNGSGKTTTIRMLMGLLRPTRGRAEVLGHDAESLPPEVRARIGYLTEEHQLYGWMKVRECGEFQRAHFAKWNDRLFRGVADHFRLKPDAKVKELSRGERAGLCLALTLAPEPELLILDDPALGLDPVARRSLMESMVYLTRRSDRTVFFSSHHLPDVERVADCVAVLDLSVLRASCPMETFARTLRRYVLRYAGPPPEAKSIPGLLQVVRANGELRLTLLDRGAATERALADLKPVSMEALPLSLEDAFVAYLGERGEKSFLFGEAEEKV